MLPSYLCVLVYIYQVLASPLVSRDHLVSRNFNSNDPYANWPSYADLPLDPSYPTKAAWGVWATTQLDGLRQFPYSEPVPDPSQTFRFYNDLIDNYRDIVGGNLTDVLGIQQAADKGIAARGVLLDYKGWMDSRNESFDPLRAYQVPISDLDRVAEWQGLEGNWTRPGDILLVRFGWLEAFGRLNETERQALVLGPSEYIGILASPRSAEWLWGKKLAMVGGDNPAFEEALAPLRYFDGQQRNLHQIMIAGWGQSILEFVDLERLAPALHATGRSTFFMTIQALNIRGGIASPPNAMALI